MASSIICPHCGAENPADSQYCDQCSLRLQAPGGSASAPPTGPAVASMPVPSAPPVISLAPPAQDGMPAPSPPAPAAQEAATPQSPAPDPTRTAPPPVEPAVSELPLGEKRGIPITPPSPPVATPTTPVAPRRRGSPALLVGGTLLALGLFLGVGLAVLLLNNNNPAPRPTPAPTVAAGTTTIPATGEAAQNTSAAPTTPAQTGAATPSVAAPSTAGAGANEATAQADSLLAAKQYDQALAAYQAVLDQDAQNPAALLGKGRALLALGNYADAIGALTQALAVRGPDDETALLARAQAYMGAHQNTEALNDSDHILKSDPTSVPALLVRAWARGYSSDDAGAQADYAAAIAAAPQDPAPYRARATYYLGQRNKKAEALADLQKVTTLAPNDATAWVDLGKGYMVYQDDLRPQPDQAIDAFGHALQIDPRLAAAYYERANVYKNAKSDSAHALADLNQAIAVGPATADMYYLRAQIEQDVGDDKAELADLDRAIQVNPKSPDPYTWRADDYFRHHEYDRAAADMGSAIDLDPQAIRYVYRSQYYLLAGDFAKAEADARQATALDDSQAESHAALALVFFEQGQYTQALDPATAAIDHATDYNRGETLAIRGRIYLRLNQLDNAAKDLAAAAATNGNYGLVYLGQAELEVARKNDDAALTQFQQWVQSSDASSFGRGFLLKAQVEAQRGLPTQARNDLAEARKRALFPAEHQAADALAKQLGP